MGKLSKTTPRAVVVKSLFVALPIVAGALLWVFVAPTETFDSASQAGNKHHTEGPSDQMAEAVAPDNTTTKIQALKKQIANYKATNQKNLGDAPTTNQNKKTVAREYSALDIEKLMNEQISNEMRNTINDMLNPKNQTYQERVVGDAVSIDVSGRAFAVPIGLIDEDGNAIMVDITEPLPIKAS